MPPRLRLATARISGFPSRPIGRLLLIKLPSLSGLVRTANTISSRFCPCLISGIIGGGPWSIKNPMFHDKPVPLSNQRIHGHSKVWVYCGNPDCRHSAVLDVSHLPDETTFNELMPRMLCTVCDHRGVVTTAWHVPG
jgi:hypothetical protein